MVHTRSGSDYTLCLSRRIFLKQSDIRPHADSSTHMCQICLHEMSFLREKLPQWLQCPQCGEVVHDACMRKYVVRQGEHFACTNCRTIFTRVSFEDDIDMWSADALVDRLVQHDPLYITSDAESEDTTDGKARSLRSQSHVIA